MIAARDGTSAAGMTHPKVNTQFDHEPMLYACNLRVHVFGRKTGISATSAINQSIA